MPRGKSKVDSLVVKRMTAAFVSGELASWEIAQNLGVSQSTVSNYRRMFDGLLPIGRTIGYKLSRAGVMSQYPSDTPDVSMEVKLEKLKAQEIARRREEHRHDAEAVATASFVASHFPDVTEEVVNSQPELPGIPEISPIRIAISQLMNEKNKIDTAIEALEALL